MKKKTDYDSETDSETESESDEELSHKEVISRVKQHRKDFEGGKISIGRYFKNVGKTLNNTFKPAVPTLKAIGKQTAKVLIHQGIPAVAGALGQMGGDALAVATGNPELAPIAGTLGQQLGTMAGNKLSNLTSKKTGYGITGDIGRVMNNSSKTAQGGALMLNNEVVLSPSEKFNKVIDRIGERLEKSKDKYKEEKERKSDTNTKVKKATLKRVKNEVNQQSKAETMSERMARLRSMKKPKK